MLAEEKRLLEARGADVRRVEFVTDYREWTPSPLPLATGFLTWGFCLRADSDGVDDVWYEPRAQKL